ncbi:MAG: hypothetical protein HZC54_13430 [Verrucomicrobia bacterium]|nr:hypothetical protein [Verrucomicrobiota bacterium]
MKIQTEDIGWNLKRQCNAVIIHEDAAAESRARVLWQAIFNDMGPDIPCVVTYMTTAQMGSMLVCEGAGQIDIVIISVHDAVRCLAGGAWWLTDWLNAQSRMPRALFLLHDGDDDSDVVRGLSALAEGAGVTMFSRGHSEVPGFPATHSVPDHMPAEQFAGVS